LFQNSIPYVGIGLSLTNGNDFTNQSYPSVEVGVMRSNYALGLAIGRQNLNFRCYFKVLL
jgi:hypothetical protein